MAPSPSSERIITAANVDLSTCDRELVQYSNAIQPFGAMLVIREQDRLVVQASANAADVFGVDPERVAGILIEDVIGPEHASSLLSRCSADLVQQVPVHLGRLSTPRRGWLDVFAHRIDGCLILEFEFASADVPPMPQIYSQVRACAARMQNARTLQECLDIGVQQIRKLTGYERVQAFKFLEDGSGRVVAEDRIPDIESYIDHHFPASDVPVPARRVLSLLWVRHTPDMAYKPVPLAPEQNPVKRGLLDLSYSLTRSTSEMCNRYYLNWGVFSKLILVLLHDGRLWGLIICHQRQPHHVPHEIRTACETLANMMALLITSKEEADNAAEALEARNKADQVVERMAAEDLYYIGLIAGEPNIQTAVGAGGAAILLDGATVSIGAAPTEEQLGGICRWLRDQPPIFSTDNLAQVYPEASSFPDKAAGLLAVRLSGKDSYLLWFRPEWVHDIRWGGNPEKPLEVNEQNGEWRVGPRLRFESWKETVRGRSRPWRKFECDTAAQLGAACRTFQAADELRRSNQALAQSNLELESFAYLASHDLREPLRGIRNYSQFVRQAAGSGGPLSDSELNRLDTIGRLTDRMDGLLSSLLQYSRAGKSELLLQEADLNRVLEDALESLANLIDAHKAKVVTTKPLPTVICDSFQLGQVFTNLISNGIKYNVSPAKQVEVGVQEGELAIFYVRDNGIGIESKNHAAVFDVFRRLHGRNEFGGGSGAGLTIVRKIVERHGGRVWLESEPGKGSTFFFTLPISKEKVSS